MTCHRLELHSELAEGWQWLYQFAQPVLESQGRHWHQRKVYPLFEAIYFFYSTEFIGHNNALSAPIVLKLVARLHKLDVQYAWVHGPPLTHCLPLITADSHKLTA